MNTKIEIQSNALDIVEGISQKTGKPYKLIIQTAFLHTASEAYPVKTKILLKEGQTAYNKGEYALSDESIYVDRNGNLALNPVLVTKVHGTKAA